MSIPNLITQTRELVTAWRSALADGHLDPDERRLVAKEALDVVLELIGIARGALV